MPSYSSIFERQLIHYLALSLLLFLVFLLSSNSALMGGELIGIPTSTWFFIALITPILHQFWVWFFWRMELYGSHISNTFGDNGFKIYKIGFSILFAGRLLTIIPLAIANAESFVLSPMVRVSVSILLLIPFVYLMYSVRTYFGMDRAYGADHFDPNYRDLPLVKEGIFKYITNSMYTIGPLILWLPGLLLASYASIVVAIFNQLYIWVHYFTVEKPDMNYIYGSS